jgi:nitrogen fixation protein FixH
MDKKETNYWPYAIVGMILTVVALGIWTIKVAVTHPVQESNDYMMKYQDVDENINEILAKKRAFDARYTIDLSENRLQEGKNRIVVMVSDKAGNPIQGAKVIAIVQRPTTNAQNIEIENFSFSEGRYHSPTFQLEGKGRWNIEVKVVIGDTTGYQTWKTFVR